MKRIEGETFEVWADLFRDGHDKLRAVVKYRHEDGPWRETPLDLLRQRPLGRPLSTSTGSGLWRYTVEAWTDIFASWREQTGRKTKPGRIGARTRGRPGARRTGARRGQGRDAAASARRCVNSQASPTPSALELMLPPLRPERMGRAAPRHHPTRYPRELEVFVDPRRRDSPPGTKCLRAPRGEHARSAPFKDCIARLRTSPSWGSMSSTCRRSTRSAISTARAITTTPTRSPAIPAAPMRSARGGRPLRHRSRARHARRFSPLRAAAAARGIEVALDLAVQCAPDHPYVREHPEWFHGRTARSNSPRTRRRNTRTSRSIFGAKTGREPWEEIETSFCSGCRGPHLPGG